ncbi:MAG: insulinase family protein [Candidatus Pacearchaeota archaeon]|nr:insulinase family protein [Candidatus Pacearchaeota archaeon]
MKKKLSNGIVVLMEKRDLPIVSFSITNKFGAGFEESKIKGIAHFIEHLVFTGTKTRSHEEISKEIERRGGILNAFTSHEITSFWFKLPNEHLFVGINILLDMLKNPKFDEEKFEKEKKVILEEIKMLHDNPMRYVYEMIEENLYEKPFGEGVIGNEKTIKSLKRDFVKKYFEERYGPENYIVTIVGNADFEKVCDYLEKNFEKKNVKLKESSITKKNAKTIDKRNGLDQTHYLFAIHTPLQGTKEGYALEVLDAWLANGMSSKLFLEIREKRGLAYSVKSSINSEKNYSYYSIYVGTIKEKIKDVERIILEWFDKAKKMSEEELEGAKERVVGLKKVESEESINVMNELIYKELVGKAEDYYDYEKKIRSITLDDIKKIVEFQDYSSAVIMPK